MLLAHRGTSAEYGKVFSQPHASDAHMKSHMKELGEAQRRERVELIAILDGEEALGRSKKKELVRIFSETPRSGSAPRQAPPHAWHFQEVFEIIGEDIPATRASMRNGTTMTSIPFRRSVVCGKISFREWAA